mgnify:CR=1 FL=1
MPYENITGVIPQTVVDDVITKMTEIKTLLEPYVSNLSMEERANKYKMGPTRNSLVQNTITVIDTLPAVVPAYVNGNDVKDDYTAYGQMSPMRSHAKQIFESLDDTMMARGSEALTKGTLPIYNSIKGALSQNVPGVDAAYELLNPYFDLPDQPDGGEE